MTEKECNHFNGRYSTFNHGKCTQCGWECDHEEKEDWACLLCGERVQGPDYEPPDDYDGPDTVAEKEGER